MQTKPAIFFLTVFLIVLLFLPLIHPAFATTIFSDGFESGDFSAWTGTAGTLEVQSSITHHGTYAARFYGASADYVYKIFTAGSPRYIRIYVRFQSLLTGGAGSWNSIISSFPAPQVFVRTYNDAGTIKFALVGADTSIHITDVAISLNTWYCIELRVTQGLGSELWINGVSKATDSSTSAPSVSRFYVGYWDKSETLVNFIDCVVVADTYIGPEGDTTPPTYSNVGTNTTQAGQPCQFSVLWNDNVNVSMVFISHNSTGAWQYNITVTLVWINSTAAWANYTLTLNQTEGQIVGWYQISNDTSNNRNTSMPIQTLTVTPLTFSFSETIRPSATLNQWQEHIYTFTGTVIQSSILEYGAEAMQTFTQTTTLRTTLTYAGELAEAFITNIETITPHEIITYWIESPIDWSIVAIGLAAVAFIIAAAAIATR
jgi:hypothetical protein